MPMFGDVLRRRREECGMSLTELGGAVHYSKGYLSKVETGKKRVSEELARLCDEALAARGELIAAAHLDLAADLDAQPWQTAELLRRIQASDTTDATIDALRATVVELCCQYAYRDATELRAEAQGWLREVARLLRRAVGLAEHRELLVEAGWLALLVGCLEYDRGMRSSAESTRIAAQQLGEEAGHSEIVGWSLEMAAWFALTQGRYADVLSAARAGRDVCGQHSVTVQLVAQEAKALARVGDTAGVKTALDDGHRLLSRLAAPDRPDHHFVVDPAKWDFYAMDAHRLAGDDDRAAVHAHEVLAAGATPDGTERAPMRMSEARLTLAAIAARKGDLEQAVRSGLSALTGSRRSLPSMLMVAGELDSELSRRYPGEPRTAEFREAVRALR